MNNIKQKLKELWHYLKAEFISEQKKRLKIFLYQPRLLIFIGIIFLLNMPMNVRSMYYGVGIHIFIQTPLMTIIFIFIALSNPAEWIFRKLEDVRHIATETEKKYLNPLFEEVYAQAKKKYNTIGVNIKLYIVDTIKVESFAIGRNTIAITRGMIETMSSDELKGVFAHEFSHIAKYHSQIHMIIAIAAGTQLWFAILFEKLLRKIITLLGDNLITSIINIIRLVFVLFINIIFSIANLIILSGYRKAEYTADETVVSMGYGEELKSVLYKIYNMEISDKKELIHRIHTEHPRTAYRIERIEKLL